MSNAATVKDEFVSLREEIRSSKARLFRLIIVGLVGVPILTYIASQADFFVSLLLPYSVLLLIVVFLSEQNSMMRAGRYIRERMETGGEDSPRWESWIESRPHLRLADRHYVGCFLVVFFLYYFVTVGVVLNLILDKEQVDMSGGRTYRYWLYGALVTYLIGAIWALITLAHHWRTTISTAPSSD